MADNASLTMLQCAVVKCKNVAQASNGTATAIGGGVFLTGTGQSTFEDCLFAANICEVVLNNSTGYANGGGIYSRQDNTRFIGCRMYSNYPDDADVLEHSSFESCYSEEGISGQGYYLNNSVACGNDADGAHIGFGNLFDCSETGTTGACCSGEIGCAVMTHRDCFSYSEHPRFAGPGTDCSNSDCESTDPPGACCIDGNCGFILQSECLRLKGEWQDAFLTCETIECEPPPAAGACCLGSTCLFVTETACSVAGGIWNGESSNCDTTECKPLLGACCVAGACTQISLDDCANLGGTYFGDLTACEDIECPGTCLGDLNGDGDVSVDDILILISGYGPCP
jgi:hypothetical protein